MNDALLREANNLQVDDILANPGKYGLPTLEEFRRNPAKHRERMTRNRWVTIDNGPNTYRYLIDKFRYFFITRNGAKYEAETIEKLETIAQNEGVTQDLVEYVSQFVPTSGFKAEVHVFVHDKRHPLIITRGTRL